MQADADHLGPGSFATTRWSLVLEAGRGAPGSSQRAALSALCQGYWYPLYAYVRRRADGPESAQDLTQEFFLQLLEKERLAAAAPERGRFRSFLLASVKNFLANQRDRARAIKRGGDREMLSLDWAGAESRMNFHPATQVTPERAFERAWALTLLERVVERLQEEFAVAGKSREFAALKPTLTGDREQGPYAEIAAQLETTLEAARQAAHRLRKRYREVLRAEVAQTVADPGEIDDEIRGLMATLAE